MSSSTVQVTDLASIKNGPLAALAEGNGDFSNVHLGVLILVVPWFVKRLLPIVNQGGFKTYWFLVALLGLPVTVSYWTVMSIYGRRKNTKVALPDKNIEEYITIHDAELKLQFKGQNKIPMQVFHDAFFEGKIDFNGDSSLHVTHVLLLLNTRLFLQEMFLISWSCGTTGPR